MSEPNMSEWQRKWFETGRANLEKETGRSLDEWVAIARTCPEAAHRARLRCFKDNYGLLQNRASMVLNRAFPSDTGWNEPEKLRVALWTDPASTAILEAVEKLVKALPDVSNGQRKGYSSWSHRVQFVAVRPARGGAAILGLAADAEASPRLRPAKNEGWSERLKSASTLASATEVDGEIEALIRRAWERS
jgi:hypothetical protein